MQNEQDNINESNEQPEVVEVKPKRQPKAATPKPAPKKKRKKKAVNPTSVMQELAPKYQGAVEGRTVVTGHRYTVDLQSRHGEWLERVAAVEGRSPGNMLERLVRIAYSQDPYKGNPPDTSGSSFSGRASDLKGS